MIILAWILVLLPIVLLVVVFLIGSFDDRFQEYRPLFIVFAVAIAVVLMALGASWGLDTIHKSWNDQRQLER